MTADLHRLRFAAAEVYKAGRLERTEDAGIAFTDDQACLAADHPPGGHHVAPLGAASAVNLAALPYEGSPLTHTQRELRYRRDQLGT